MAFIPLKIKDNLVDALYTDEFWRNIADSLNPYIVIKDGSLWADLESLDSNTLDHLAYSLGLNNYNLSWPINIKINMIKRGAYNRKLQGTRYAVEEGIRHLGSVVKIVEWWEKSPKGDPYTFEVQVAINEIPPEEVVTTIEFIYESINTNKSVRSHYGIKSIDYGNGILGFYGHGRSTELFIYNTGANEPHNSVGQG